MYRVDVFFCSCGGGNRTAVYSDSLEDAVLEALDVADGCGGCCGFVVIV